MSKIQMHIDNWTYEDFNEFLDVMQTGDMERQHSLAEKLLIGWEYEVPFEDGLMALGVEEGAQVLRTVVETLQAVSEDLDSSEVKVDFSSWNTRRFLDFTRANKDGNNRRVERMLHEVCKLKGINSDEPLKFQDGAKMMKAVTEKYKRLITGKN